MPAESDAHLYFEIGRGRTIVKSKGKETLKKEKNKNRKRIELLFGA